MTRTITSRSPDDTLDIGRRFAPLLTAGDLVLLSGRLGAGKTLFVAGVAEGLGIPDRVTSPSFVIARVYRDGFLPLVHADAYRLGSIAEFLDLDLASDGSDGATLIEWGDAVAESLPADRLTIRFSILDDGSREISFEPEGSWVERDLAVLA